MLSISKTIDFVPLKSVYTSGKPKGQKDHIVRISNRTLKILICVAVYHNFISDPGNRNSNRGI